MIAETDSSRICVRVPTARRKYVEFMRRLQRKPQIYYSFRFNGNFVFLDAAEVEAVKPLATKARVDLTQLCQCWS